MNYRRKQEVADALQKAAARYVERAVAIAADIMEDENAKNADRMTAVKFIADRAAGKASQEFIIDTPDTDEMDELMEIAQRQTREVLMLPAPVEQPLDNVIPMVSPKKKSRVRIK